MATNARREVATLAGGCFWCVEAVFEQVRGVERVLPGYSGGHIPNPSYEQVCSESTGHAEAAQVTFDPGEVSYEELLKIFFATHDPTTLNRQGPDVGTQYRSVVFYHSEEQKAAAERVISELGAGGAWGRPIVTQVVPLTAFYLAEDYHREYYRRHSWEPYCQIVISPKVAKLRKEFLAKLKR